MKNDLSSERAPFVLTLLILFGPYMNIRALYDSSTRPAKRDSYLRTLIYVVFIHLPLGSYTFSGFVYLPYRSYISYFHDNHFL